MISHYWIIIIDALISSSLKLLVKLELFLNATTFTTFQYIDLKQ